MMGETRIGSIQLIVTSTMGTGMAALDDLSYVTAGATPAPAPGDGGGSSAISGWFAMVLSGLVVLLRRKKQLPVTF